MHLAKKKSLSPKLFARQRLHADTYIPINRMEDDNWPSPGMSWVYQPQLAVLLGLPTFLPYFFLLLKTTKPHFTDHFIFLIPPLLS